MAGFLLTACAGGQSQSVPPIERVPWATVEVAVDVHGNARVSVLLAARMHLDVARALTADVAATIFPAVPAGDVQVLATATTDPTAPPTTVPEPAQGVTLLPGAVPPGTSPSFAIDGAALDARLRRDGIRALRLSLCLPAVPATTTVDPPTRMVTVEGCRLWLPERSAPLPSVAVSLHPEAWRWATGVLGAFLALGLGVTGLVRRSRVAALASLAVLMATVILGLGGTDDAQMAGLLGGGATLIAGGAAALVAGTVAAVADVVALGRRSRSSASSTTTPERPAVPVH